MCVVGPGRSEKSKPNLGRWSSGRRPCSNEQDRNVLRLTCDETEKLCLLHASHVKKTEFRSACRRKHTSRSKHRLQFERAHPQKAVRSPRVRPRNLLTAFR